MRANYSWNEIVEDNIDKVMEEVKNACRKAFDSDVHDRVQVEIWIKKDGAVSSQISPKGNEIRYENGASAIRLYCIGSQEISKEDWEENEDGTYHSLAATAPLEGNLSREEVIELSAEELLDYYDWSEKIRAFIEGTDWNEI